MSTPQRITWDAEARARLRALWYDLDLTTETIAERMGSVATAIRSAARNHNLPSRRSLKHLAAQDMPPAPPADGGEPHWSGAQGWSDEQVAYLRQHWIDSHTVHGLARALGRTENAVIGKAYRLGLQPRSGLGPAVDTGPPEQTSTRATCAWINGDVLAGDWHYCHAPVEPERPYCPDHCQRAYRRVYVVEADGAGA